MRPEQIPYGVKDFRHIRLENFHSVDKTAYIRELEVRPFTISILNSSVAKCAFAEMF